MRTWMFGTLVCLAVAACGSEDDGGMTPDTGPCTEPHSMCATLHVPDDYAATPVKVIVAMYEQLPPVGPPSDVAAIIEQVAIGPDLPYELELDGMMAEGDYFIYIALYNEGGGTFQPVVGVDNTWSSSGTHDMLGPINLGDITLALHQE